MLYEKFFKIAEHDRWCLETDIPWNSINAKTAESQPDMIENLRKAALIESYAPMYALKGLEVWWNSVEESAIASIQFYEEYKHYYVLKRYLQHIDISIPDREVIELREKNARMHYTNRVRQLANYMMSEHFTAYFYMRLLEQAHEESMKVMLTFLMRDEFRHSNIFYALLEKHLAENRDEAIQIILDEALHFKHQGAEAVGEDMPIAVKNDLQTLLLFVKKIERLTGVNLREYKKSLMTHEPAVV